MPRTDSPLRYPGGKTQLKDFVLNTMHLNSLYNATYVEPYSGGFGVGISLLLQGDVDRVVINDFDRSIYSVWYSILNHTDALITLIENTPITIESWYEQKELNKLYKKYRNSLENGFSTLFLNRTNRSGIINAGPIGGYNQKGNDKIDCRFNKNDIIRKIRTIAEQRERIDLYQKDAVKLVDLIKEKYDSDSTFIFFDPPYYVQGNKLYTNFYKHGDHKRLAKKIADMNDFHWITTYDYAPQIQELYTGNNIETYIYELFYSAQTKRKATEFLFANNKTDLHSYSKVLLSKI